jgi:hypothetical protein
MAKPKPFNGTNKEIRKMYLDHLAKGGTTTEFNNQFSSITVNGREVLGMRTDGIGKDGKLKAKINYADVVNTYQNKRKENVLLSTPNPEDRKRGAQVFKANEGNTGTDVDHKIRVERTGGALREMDIPRQAKYHAAFAEANIPIGDDPGNLEIVETKFNRGADFKEHQILDKHLKGMEKTSPSPTLQQLKKTKTTSPILNTFRMDAFQRLGFRAMTPIMEYGTAIDELTGGHINKGVQHVVNMFRQAVGQKPNPIRGY